MRCDRKDMLLGVEVQVSIHAPTWGATYNFRWPLRLHRFQSTHLHEVRLIEIRIFCNIFSFNPRTYMRCDLPLVEEQTRRKVSIHAPTWGATGYLVTTPQASIGFNPRTYMRCDCIVNNWLTNIVQRYTFREYMQSYVIEKASCLMWYLICW